MFSPHLMSHSCVRELELGQLEGHLEEIFSSGYSVSLFTDWQNHRITQVWIKSRVTESSPPLSNLNFLEPSRNTKFHPLAGHSPENCTEQMGVPGPWYERLPHFRMNLHPVAAMSCNRSTLFPATKPTKPSSRLNS